MPFEYLMQGDCLERMREIPDGYVDLVLCDLPYGTTACKWDTIIPFDDLWAQYWRICSGAVVLHACQPFTSVLVTSQIKYFKYDWSWRKNIPTGFASAKSKPMRAHEEILVFAKAPTVYNKQPTKSNIKDRKLGGSNGIRATAKDGVYGNLKNSNTEIILKENISPRSFLEIDCVPRATGTLHPTQKPVELAEYMVLTYTNEDQIVLDNTMGSGTTGVACVNTGRSFIGIEKDESYFAIAQKRIADAKAAREPQQ